MHTCVSLCLHAGCDLTGLDGLYTPAAFADAVEALTASSTRPPWSNSAADALSMPPPHKRPRLADNTPASPSSMLPPNTPGNNSINTSLSGSNSNGSLQGQAAERVATWQELLAARNTVIGAAGAPQLDPNSQQVTAKTLIDVAPLLQLPQLRKLRLTGCSCSGDTLLRLTAIQSLQELELSFERPSDATFTTRAWPRLPVSSISFGGCAEGCVCALECFLLAVTQCVVCMFVTLRLRSSVVVFICRDGLCMRRTFLFEMKDVNRLPVSVAGGGSKSKYSSSATLVSFLYKNAAVVVCFAVCASASHPQLWPEATSAASPSITAVT